MAKQVLRLDDCDQQYDFILIGIICQHKDYRLCYEINRRLEINLAKCEDYELTLKARKTVSAFTRFRYKNSHRDEFVLLSNKGSRGVLLPEQPQLDYLLMITENQPQDSLSGYVKLLKDIPIILGVFPLDPLQLPSREHLIME